MTCTGMDSYNRLSVIWKSDLTDKMKRSFFQAAVVSILLYGCTTWTYIQQLCDDTGYSPWRPAGSNGDIGRGGERGLRIFVPMAWHDDDDDLVVTVITLPIISIVILILLIFSYYFFSINLFYYYPFSHEFESIFMAAFKY